MKKILEIIFILFILLINNSYASKNLINVKCVYTFKQGYDKNREIVSNLTLNDDVIYSFDKRKKQLVQTNFTIDENLPAIINKSEINWHMYKQNPNDEFIKERFDMIDPGLVVNAYKINRFTGDFDHKLYVLNSFWTLKYVGAKLDSEGKWKRSDTDHKSLKFLQVSKKNLADGLSQTKSNIPQKSILYIAHMKGECSKTTPKQKF